MLITNGLEWGAYALEISLQNGIANSVRPNNIGVGVWARQMAADSAMVARWGQTASNIFRYAPWVGTALDVITRADESRQAGVPQNRIITDAVVDTSIGAASIGVGTVVSNNVTFYITSYMATGAKYGKLIGAIAGAVVGWLTYEFADVEIGNTGITPREALQALVSEETRPNPVNGSYYFLPFIIPADILNDLLNPGRIPQA